MKQKNTICCLHKKIETLIFLFWFTVLSLNLNAQVPIVRTHSMVATCVAGKTIDHVMVLTDAPTEGYNSNTYPTSASSVPGITGLGNNGVVNEFMHPNWTVEQIGTIFYTEFDRNGSIYMPASRITKVDRGQYDPGGVDMSGQIGDAFAAGLGGTLDGRDVIYKTDPFTGEPAGWAAIETNQKGFGGITYDETSNTFYVVNMGDFTIYQLDAAGIVIDNYTPVLGGSGFQRRPAALDINPVDDRLYYTVIRADNVLEIRSIGLGVGGAMTGTDIQEATTSLPPFTYDPGDVGESVAGDIDFNATGDMAVGTWTTHESKYYTSELARSLYNHISSVYIFENSGAGYSQTATTTVAQVDFNGFTINRSATSGVAWNTDPDLPAEILWMSGGDFAGEDSKWGVIGYDSNQFGNTLTQETASNYIQFLFNPVISTSVILPDPKGNGGDVDIYDAPDCVDITAAVPDLSCTCSVGGTVDVPITVSFESDPTIGIDPASMISIHTDNGSTQTFALTSALTQTFTLEGISTAGTEQVFFTLMTDGGCYATFTVCLPCFAEVPISTPTVFSGTANGYSPPNTWGPIAPAGTTADNTNSYLSGTGGATLNFDDTIPLGETITVSLARSSTSATISDGTNSIVFNSGTLGQLYHITFVTGVATNSLTISMTNGNGSVWIDGAEYSFTADVASINCESSCPDCTNPVLTALTDETICDGDNFTISNVTTSETTGLTVSYQWFNNNGTDNANTDPIASETTATLMALPTAVGTYSYRVVATNTADNTCTAEQTVNLIINGSPTLSIDGATCDAGDTTYTIDFTSDSTVTSTAGTVVGNQVIDIPAGTDVTLTATLNGCTTEETIISPDCGPNCPTTRCMKIILTKQN